MILHLLTERASRQKREMRSIIVELFHFNRVSAYSFLGSTVTHVHCEKMPASSRKMYLYRLV